MRLPDGELSPEAHAAIVECLRIAARRGKQLRLERERAARAKNAEDAKRGVPAGSEAETGSPPRGTDD